MSEASTWQPVGFRLRLTLALAGVLALVVPQVVVTVTAMVRLYDGGTEVARLSALGGRVEALASSAEELFAIPVPAAPGTVHAAADALLHRLAVDLAGNPAPDTARELAAAVTRWRDAAPQRRRSTVTGPAAPAFAALAQEHREALAAIASWHERSPDATDAAATAAHVRWLEERLARPPGRLVFASLVHTAANSAADAALAALASHRVSQAARDARSHFDALRAALHSALAAEAAALEARVDAANRYLVTLVLLTLIYVAALILLLPGRLVGPLRHLRAVMDRAATGHPQVEARALGADEIGQLGRSLNGLLQRERDFDALKRDRIAQDRGHLRHLLDLVGEPFAILDTHHRVEHANRAFRALLRLPEDDEGRVLTDLLSGDGAERPRQARVILTPQAERVAGNG